MNDLESAFRRLFKNPGFTAHPPQGHCYGGRAAAVLTLGFGVGAKTFGVNDQQAP